MLYNKGRELAKTGDLQAALKHYKQAVLHDKSHARAWNNMANIAKRLGDFKESINYYERSLKAHKTSNTWVNLGNTFLELGNTTQSTFCYQQALKLEPTHIHASVYLGASLIEQGLLDQAFKHISDALKQHVNHPGLLITLGNLYIVGGRAADAVDVLTRGLSVIQNPTMDFILTLSSAYSNNSEPDKALALLKKFQPKYTDSETLNLALGRQYKSMGYAAKAQSCFSIVSKMRPKDLLAGLRYLSFFPSVIPSIQAIKLYRTRLSKALDVALNQQWRLNIDELAVSGCEPSFNLSFQGKNDLVLKRKYGELFSKNLPKFGQPKFGKERPHIGAFVTSGHEGIFLKSVLPMLNRFSYRELKATVVCPKSSLNALQKQANTEAIEFLPMVNGLTNNITNIRRAGFDLMYYHEVGSDSLNYFLPFMRMAPIQCTTWGIQVTSGIPTMDYYLSSTWMEPEQAQQHYSEKLVLLDTLLKYQSRPKNMQKVNTREELGLSEHMRLYVCLQHLGKLHPHFDSALAGILRDDPNGSIVLVEWPTPEDARQLWNRFHKKHPDLSNRIVILPHLQQQDYYALIQCSDILLDPFYSSGVNCTYDALAFNKVVITWPGEFQRGRFTLGCYQRLGILDAVASSPDDYIKKAISLGTDPVAREALEQRLAERSEILFTDTHIAPELENTLLQLILEGRAGKSGQA